jgi:hypothetical protein
MLMTFVIVTRDKKKPGGAKGSGGEGEGLLRPPCWVSSPANDNFPKSLILGESRNSQINIFLSLKNNAVQRPFDSLEPV